MTPVRAESSDDGDLVSRSIAHGQLGRTARRGLMWSLGSQWVGLVVQTVTAIVLARLLDPRAFGLVGMAMTLTIFADQFRSLGLSQAVVQRPDLTWRQVNALFWINSGFGMVLAVVVVLAAPLVAAFYGEPELVLISCVLAGSYVVSGLAVQPNALLTRTLSFKALGLRNSAARILASVAAVAAALAGAGYWSLVVLQVGLAVFSALLVWLAIDWRPSRPSGFRETRPLLAFGAGITFAELSNTLSRHGDNVVIGRFLGAADLGLYSRAYSLLMLPIRQLKTPLGTVVQPMLAAVQHEPERYRRLYCATISGLAHIGVPGTVGLAVFAHPMVETLLGPQWLPAATVFQLLAVAGVVQLVSSTCGWLLITTGRAAQYARLSVVTGIATVLSFLAGLPWGIEGVAAGYALGQALLVVPSFWYCSRGTSVTFGAAAAALWRPVGVTLLVAAPLLAVAVLLHSQPSWLLLLAGVLTGVASWLVVLAAWRGARREITGMLGLVRSRRSGPGGLPGRQPHDPVETSTPDTAL